ncbi:DUF349 domain-containing protein [Pseudofulvibacter geojedonensis]|uniref:DUF349 domain-containing protein n=1 Tax=Pseudofulvibacter geojedonensis TaxID=1123758 RepID=A0ABW3I0I6_9FLAO
MSEIDNLQEADGLEKNTPVVQRTEATEKDVVQEIENENAEDAEDNENAKRHEIEAKDYHAMNMESLVNEFSELVQKHPIQAISKHVNQIKEEFNAKYSELIEAKKEEFLAEGGNEIDFKYHSNTKAQFNTIYADFRSKRNAYYKNLEESLKNNLNKRNAIIEEIKGLVGIDENINTTYKQFKDLQESWRNAGPIPRDRYNTVWNTYHHHVERFYDFLHLNRDLRDLDFKHNLELKQKMVIRAEELSKEEDVMKAFRELQLLHKTWKEDIGPVSKEHREEIWTRFSNATKVLHDRRQEHFNELDKRYEVNLATKNEIINKIRAIAADTNNNHKAWQEKIKSIEALRTSFFNAGKVPIKVNEETWASFKQAVRDFNKNKNAFYKNIKKDQLENLTKKLALIEIAEANMDNDDFQATTPLMKKIQADWRKIGHVPKKDSDKIWKRFKTACNAYFDKLHAKRNEANESELEALKAKEAYIETLKQVSLEGEHQDKLNTIKEHIAHWKTLGKVPRNKLSINDSFNAVIDNLFNQLDIDKNEAEKIKYQNKLSSLEGDNRALENELLFVKRKIDEIKSEINQLENNLAFFSNAKKDNPLVKDVYKKIDQQKNNLNSWKQKIQQVKSMFTSDEKEEENNTTEE